MELAHLAILSANEVKLHQRQRPASFEKIISTPTRTIRYFADSPLVCYGEYLRDHLEKPHQLTVYFEQLGSNSWYACVMDADGVLQERIGSYPLLCDALAYDIYQAHTLFTTATFPSLEGIDHKSIKQIALPPNDEARLSSYRLTKPATKNSVMNTVILLVALVAIAGFFLFPEKETPAPIVQVITPEQSWLKQYQQSVPIHSALINTQHAFVMATLLPIGIEANRVQLQSNALFMAIKTNEKSNQNQWRSWKANHPSFSALLSDKEGGLSEPLSRYTHRQSLPQYRQDTAHKLIQHLQRFNIIVHPIIANKHMGAVLINDYQLTLNELPLGAMTYLAETLQSPMLSLSQLELTLSDTSTVSGSLRITLQGMTP